MKKTFILAGLLVALTATAQIGNVGINNRTPKATLHIDGKTNDGSKVEGVILPKQTKLNLAKLQENSITPEEGTIVYVTDTSAGTGTTVANISQKGYYIFENGTWNPMKIKKSTDYNKTYTCTSANAGEILNSTMGYFKCQDTPTMPEQYAWMYYGMSEGFGTPKDAGDKRIVRFTIKENDMFDNYNDYDIYYAYGHLNEINYITYLNENKANGNGYSVLPKYGIMSFYYMPNYYCVKSLFNGSNNYEEVGYAVSDGGIGDIPNCGDREILVESSYRSIKFHILED